MSFVHCAPPRKCWSPKSPDFEHPKSADLDSVFRQNKSPFAIALGDWFPLKTYFLTSKASPNDTGMIVIVIIIVIGEAELISHSDGIIAQTLYLGRGHLLREDIQPGIIENATAIAMLIRSPMPNPIAKRFVIIVYQQY
jgi:hypothetical protein